MRPDAAGAAELHGQCLVITRGYPASGKSTWAQEWAAAAPGRARVNRDDLRRMLFGHNGGPMLASKEEDQVSVAEQAQVEALLRSGMSVVVDATHLRLKHARAWANMAATLGVGFAVQDFPISADQCVEYDAARGAAGGRVVGEKVIREMAGKFPINRWPRITPTIRTDDPIGAPYYPDESLPKAYLADIDGTLAQMHDRSPFAWHLVHRDRPVDAVVRVVRHLSDHARIIVMSGRDESCRLLTEQWLHDHGIPFHDLHMRPERDQRKDSIVKAELFDKHVRDNYHVLGVFDDRLSVCRQWYAMGLPLFRVGDPDADF